MVALLHMCSGFPTKLMEQTIVMSLDDITRFSCLIEGRSIKGEHNRARKQGLLLLQSSGCFDTSVRVFTKPQDPLPWLSWCPSSRKHILDVQCYFFFT